MNKHYISIKFFNLLIMKKIFLLLSFCLFAGSFCTIYGQSENGKFRQHTGFYLSMSVGPVFGTITDDLISPTKGLLKLSGTGAKFDIKIGGAVKENLILHATFFSSVLNGPEIKSNFVSVKASDNMSINENMVLGGGLTYYIMPANIFLSGSIGMGNYSITDTKNSTNSGTTDNGFSMQLKVGKEWWVGKRWGLGATLTYGKTSVHNGPRSGMEEKLNSDRFGVLFNATFN
jgi:hypothetical protein